MSRHAEGFRTHANYLHAFAMLCSTPYQPAAPQPYLPLRTVMGHLAVRTVCAPTMVRPKRAAPEPEQALRSLQNAWGTEALLVLGGRVASDEELVRLVNNWAVVQAYYVGYHAVQALIVARGHPRPADHGRTQKQFAALWTDRPVDLPPWSLAAGRDGWRNPPPRGIDDSLSAWSSCDPESCWNLAAKALRTTREEKVRESLRTERDRQRVARRRAWELEETTRRDAGRPPRTPPAFAPRLGAAIKAQMASKVRSHTLLDYLYRLRVKTNYEDAGMFLEGPPDHAASRRVHRDLVTIAACTLLVHELHVASCIGRDVLLAWVDDWLVRNGIDGTFGLPVRRELLASYAPML